MHGDIEIAQLTPNIHHMIRTANGGALRLLAYSPTPEALEPGGGGGLEGAEPPQLLGGGVWGSLCIRAPPPQLEEPKLTGAALRILLRLQLHPHRGILHPPILRLHSQCFYASRMAIASKINSFSCKSKTLMQVLKVKQ